MQESPGYDFKSQETSYYDDGYVDYSSKLGKRRNRGGGKISKGGKHVQEDTSASHQQSSHDDRLSSNTTLQKLREIRLISN